MLTILTISMGNGLVIVLKPCSRKGNPTRQLVGFSLSAENEPGKLPYNTLATRGVVVSKFKEGDEVEYLSHYGWSTILYMVVSVSPQFSWRTHDFEQHYYIEAKNGLLMYKIEVAEFQLRHTTPGECTNGES